MNCDRFGRLYTWAAAKAACKQLGEGWELPSDEDWIKLADAYGGIYKDSIRNGHDTFIALTEGGESGFDAQLGGGKNRDATFGRLNVHGFYWTTTETSDSMAVFYNFGHGGKALYRQSAGEKDRAFSVRCVKRKE